ncbi:sensor histidine kinase [Clostridia bacterium]|nr:sensor histidine kinase [Clostridia bacterium]
MNMFKLFIDLLNAGCEIYLVTLFYKTFCRFRSLKKPLFFLGFLSVALLNVLCIKFVHVPILLLLSYVTIVFLLGFYFKTTLTSQLALTTLFVGFRLIAETLMGLAQTKALAVSIEQIQGNNTVYMAGMIGSNLISLVFVRILRFFVPQKEQRFHDKGFNLSMMFLPLQALLLCLLVQGITVRASFPYLAFLSNIALLASILLIVVTIFIMNTQYRSMEYKHALEVSQHRLQAQIAHYDELYSSQEEIKSMRHALQNEFVALSGFLKENKVVEAMDYIAKQQAQIVSTRKILNTGFPPIDAIVNSKMKKAEEIDSTIFYKMMIDNDLFVDPFDIAIILGNSLDNALEALEKSVGIDRAIQVQILNANNYVSICIENHTSEPFHPDLETTKDDKRNHGFGIRQMRDIAKKYDGNLTADFDGDNQIFTLTILLKQNMP